jgi:hypothetical protein
MFAQYHQPLITVEISERDVWKEVHAKIGLSYLGEARVRALVFRSSAIILLVSGHFPTGRTDFRASNLMLRLSANPRTMDSFAKDRDLFSGSAGVLIAFVIARAMKFSNAIRCSIFSAMDHRSGATRNVHCFGVRPFTSCNIRASLETSRSSIRCLSYVSICLRYHPCSFLHEKNSLSSLAV